MSELYRINPEMYDRIRIMFQEDPRSQNCSTDDEADKLRDDLFNNETFTESNIDYEYYIRDGKTMFKMLKYIHYHYDEFRYKLEDTINLFAFFCAGEIMNEFIKVNPDEDYTRHNDEDDVELQQ